MQLCLPDGVDVTKPIPVEAGAAVGLAAVRLKPEMKSTLDHMKIIF